MPQDFETQLKDQLGKLTEDFTKLQQEVAELRTRLARMEQERAQAAADSLEASF